MPKNKRASGKVIKTVGRPRTVSPPPVDMIELGKEMVAWVKANDPLHLSEWYTIQKGYVYSQWETMIKRPEFVGYYEQALKLIGIKYLDKNSNIRDGISQRWQRIYFADLREQEDLEHKMKLDREFEKEKKKIDYEASKQINTTASPFEETISLRHENSFLRAEIAKLKENLNIS
jgi:hypothetical protein